MDEVEIQTLNDLDDSDNETDYDSDNSENDSGSCDVIKEEVDYEQVELSNELEAASHGKDTGDFLETTSDIESIIKRHKSFFWSKKTTLLLLREYKIRLDRFRNPQCRKSDLWNEISNVYCSYGYEIHGSLLDKKFRNLKNTFVNIFFNNISKNSKKPVKWDYYYIFLDLFKDDDTFKLPASYEIVRGDNGINLEFLTDKDLDLSVVKPISKTSPTDKKPIVFSWNQEKCFLLLREYKARLPLFRDPKQQKKELWTEIKNAFKSLGYETNEEILYKKFRNMKQTYRSNINSDKKVKWIYQGIFAEIFDDLPINELSSLSRYDSGSIDLNLDLHNDISNEINEYLESAREHQSEISTDENAISILEIQRKRLKLDEERTAEMKKLRKVLETSNQLQKTRNDLLEVLIDVIKSK